MNIFTTMMVYTITLLLFIWSFKIVVNLENGIKTKGYITKKRLLYDCIYLVIYLILTYVSIGIVYHFTVIENNASVYSEQGLIVLGTIYPVVINAVILDVTVRKFIKVISDIISFNKQKKDTVVNRFFKTLDNGTDEEIRNQYYSLKYTPIVECSLSNEQTFRVISALIKCEEYKEAESLSRQLGGLKRRNTNKAVLKSVE